MTEWTLKFFRLVRLPLCAGLLLVLGFGQGNCGTREEFTGLLVDQTRTRVGQEFYRQFSSLWGEIRSPISYNLSISEIPDARWGSLISVALNGRIAYRNMFRPRTSDIADAVPDAVSRTRDYLIYLIRTNGHDASDDLKGDGY